MPGDARAIRNDVLRDAHFRILLRCSIWFSISEAVGFLRGEFFGFILLGRVLASVADPALSVVHGLIMCMVNGLVVMIIGRRAEPGSRGECVLRLTIPSNR
jgi:hypothetical protein